MTSRERWRLVLEPSLVALGVTVLRLLGERGHWSERWFSSETSGIVPRGTSWLFGITWLAAPFGIYFAARLMRSGEGPRRPGRALALCVLGVAFLLVAGRLAWKLPVAFPPILIFVWLVMVAAAAPAWLGWPALARTLLAYGLASRVVVVAVMLLAMRGNWGTHYDYVGMPSPFQMPFWPRFLWLAFFPQLVFWVAFTILLGSVTGSLFVALFLKLRPRVA